MARRQVATLQCSVLYVETLVVDCGKLSYRPLDIGRWLPGSAPLVGLWLAGSILGEPAPGSAPYPRLSKRANLVVLMPSCCTGKTLSRISLLTSPPLLACCYVQIPAWAHAPERFWVKCDMVYCPQQLAVAL